MPPNFANAKIYAIRSHQTPQIYIGSTTQTLAQRFAKHKNSMNCTSRQILVFDDVYIELIESYSCANKNELNRREGELIRLHDCVNKQIAGRTDAEYREEHKDEFKRYYKQYKIDNKEQIKQQKGKSNMCGCGIQYTHNHKQRHFKSNNHKEFMRTLETTSA